MCRSALVVLLCSLMTGSAGAQQSQARTISPDAPSGDSVAIYRDVLAHYYNGAATFPINLARYTRAFPDGIGDDQEACIADVDHGVDRGVIIHDLSKVSAWGEKVTLVDPAQHKISDPGSTIRRGGAIDQSVRQGFAAALFTFSEVVFSRDRRLAALRYSFVCGALCGNGGTIVYERTNTGWKDSKRNCVRWIS